MISRLRDLHKKYEKQMPIVFFVLGFTFDAVMLNRIDEPMVIIQQALYIILSAALIGVELVEITRAVATPRALRLVWPYRKDVLHFMLGTLLNSYTIFYFMSSSALTSFFFIALLISLLFVNEFTHFNEDQTRVHVAFLSLCVVSYLVALTPVALGFIGVTPFLAAVVLASSVLFGYYFLLTKRLGLNRALARSHVGTPSIAIVVVFTALYFLHVIPPVPLSVKYMGIFHEAHKKNGVYELTYTRSRWKFWQHGDQTFKARAGDNITCFVQVFSPGRFKDQLSVRWLYRDERRGWLPADAIPLAIVGGRDEGFRAVTTKSNYQPGDWRVQVETRDGRQIGSIGLTVEMDDSTEPRVERQIQL